MKKNHYKGKVSRHSINRNRDKYSNKDINGDGKITRLIRKLRFDSSMMLSIIALIISVFAIYQDRIIYQTDNEENVYIKVEKSKDFKTILNKTDFTIKLEFVFNVVNTGKNPVKINRIDFARIQKDNSSYNDLEIDYPIILPSGEGKEIKYYIYCQIPENIIEYIEKNELIKENPIFNKEMDYSQLAKELDVEWEVWYQSTLTKETIRDRFNLFDRLQSSLPMYKAKVYTSNKNEFISEETVIIINKKQN